MCKWLLNNRDASLSPYEHWVPKFVFHKPSHMTVLKHCQNPIHLKLHIQTYEIAGEYIWFVKYMLSKLITLD